MKTLKTKYRAEVEALRNAIHRCTNPQNTQWADYGGRGITVDPVFTGPNGLENFLKEVGPKPSPELTLDRISNSKGYEPGNLTWATRKSQVANRRPNRPQVSDLGWGFTKYTVVDKNGRNHSVNSPLVPLGDRLLSLQEWSEELGVNTRTLRQRLKRGATPEEALVPVLFSPWGKPRNDSALMSAVDNAIALLDLAASDLASRQHGNA